MPLALAWSCFKKPTTFTLIRNRRLQWKKINREKYIDLTLFHRPIRITIKSDMHKKSSNTMFSENVMIRRRWEREWAFKGQVGDSSKKKLTNIEERAILGNFDELYDSKIWSSNSTILLTPLKIPLVVICWLRSFQFRIKAGPFKAFGQ